MSQSYTAQDIEVLSGLEPVRRRPGMYTDTSRPNHLAHEVVDNSVDEALAGHCSRIDVTALQGRLARGRRRRPRHAGGHPPEGEGQRRRADPHAPARGRQVLADRATSSPAACTAWASRSSTRCRSTSSAGCAAAARNTTSRSRTGRCTRSSRSSATSARATPAPRCASGRTRRTSTRPSFALPKLKHVLKAKAVLCPGLRVRFNVEKTGEKEEWLYTEGLSQYLRESLESSRMAAGRAVHRQGRGRAGRRRLGRRLAHGRRHAVRGELRQPDPDARRAARTSTASASA